MSVCGSRRLPEECDAPAMASQSGASSDAGMNVREGEQGMPPYTENTAN